MLSQAIPSGAGPAPKNASVREVRDLCPSTIRPFAGS